MRMRTWNWPAFDWVWPAGRNIYWPRASEWIWPAGRNVNWPRNYIRP